MEFDFETLPVADRYKIMTSTIVPRPIAWVTTLSKDGIRNAAPISFFNGMGKDPPVLALGIQPNDGSLKDTARNILDTHEFVVNLVPESAAQAMNITSIDAPPDVDELALANIATVPSLKVKPTAHCREPGRLRMPPAHAARDRAQQVHLRRHDPASPCGRRLRS